ncbi:MAG TPA: hypothetical protein VEP90_27695, partial [Methylomirabilota bacterium]|nr:hypothetical protein [Methylomirabilota bacterium]
MTLSIDILYYAITKLCWAYQKEAWFLQSHNNSKLSKPSNINVINNTSIKPINYPPVANAGVNQTVS